MGARILLTSPLESFTVGRTIVLSRGLIDVLPDEASLVMMLAHELAHIVLDHPVIDTKFAFADALMVPDNKLLKTVRYRHTTRDETAADKQEGDRAAAALAVQGQAVERGVVPEGGISAGAGGGT